LCAVGTMLGSARCHNQFRKFEKMGRAELGGPSPPGKYPELDMGEMLWGLPFISAIARPR
jgi:hypothetical protein